MADVQSNIHVNIDTSDALASLKLLQRQISAFHTQMAKSGASASAVAANQAQNLMNSINATGQFQASLRKVTSSTEHFTDALERNKLTSREYFRYTGAATKTFGRLFRSEFETINKVARERVKDIQTQYIKLGRGANGALESIAVRPLTLDMKNLGTQTAIAAQRQQLLNQLLKQGSTNLLNFGKNTQWAGRQLMVGFTVPLAMLGTTAAKTFMKLEEQAIRFKRVYGEMFTTQEETDAMVKQIQTLAKEYTKYGVAVEETMKMAADAAAMGKQGAELTAQVAQATRLAVLGGVEQAQALETTISITNAFGIAAEDLAKKIDFLNSVENQTVVSIEDLTIAIPKAGPVVQQLGGDVEDLAFFLTAMKEGGINASEGANALKSGLASLINPSEKASKFLAGLGVNIKGIVEANQGDVTKTVVGFAQALDTLDPLNRARAIEQLFGKFQFSRLSTLFQNVTAQGTQASRVLGLAQATTEELAILSQRELDKIEDTTTYKFKKAIEDLKVTIAPVGEQFLKALTPIVEFASKVLEKFNNLGDGSKKFLTIFTVAVGGIGPILLMTFGLIANAAANIIKLFANMKSMYNRAGSASKVLGEQTSYLTKEQLEASAVAASLDQVHTRLKQTFTSETTAVNALAAAYRRAIAAQVGFTGPVRGGAGGKGLKKYSNGTTSVPGTGNKDTVPTMLTPGEAVIPAQAAQDPANRPVIARMVAGETIQGFSEGTTGVTKKGKRRKVETDFAHATSPQVMGVGQVPPEFEGKAKDLGARGIDKAFGYRGLGFDIASDVHARLRDNRVEVREYEAELRKPRAVETMTANLMKPPSSLTAEEAAKVTNRIRKNLILSLQGLPDGTLIGDKTIYSRMGNLKTGILGGLARDPRLAPAIESIYAVAGVGGGSKASVKYNGKMSVEDLIEKIKKDGPKTNRATISAIEDLKLKAPGIMLDVLTDKDGKLIGYERPEVSGKKNSKDPKDWTLTDKKNNGSLVGDRFATGRSGGDTGAVKIGNTSKPALLKAARGVLQGLTGEDIDGKPVTTYGKQISKGTGYSNVAARDASGVFETADGKKVYVKPMVDLKSAIAEQRATQIARDVHGLDAPKQELRIIKDPYTGKLMYALESAFDSKFDPNQMDKKFNKDQYFRQLVAANLRADKDLKKGNLGGNILADVGTAGVFDRASGARDYAAKLPSMLEMAEKNLSGVKGPAAGNSPFWFGNATADIAKKMTADEYHRSMINEIDRVLPRLKETIKSFGLGPEDQKVYQAMIDRLEEGKKVDWRAIHAKHSSILVKPDEMIEDEKGNLKKPKTKPKPKGVKSSSGSSKDTRITAKPKKGTRVVQGPKGSVTVAGFADAPESQGAVATALVNGAKGSLAEARAVGANIGTTISQSAAAASRTMLYGTGPVDADAKSVRRQLEKRQKAEAKTQAKAAASRTALYGTGPIDADAKSMRRNAQKEMKRSKLAEKVAYKQSIIDQKAAEEAKKRTLSGRTKTYFENREAKKQAKIAAGKSPGMGMAGAVGIASGAAMIGSMAPGKVGEISQKVMMPLMGLAMVLPMLKSPMAAVAIGLTATVGAFVALRMAFDNAQRKVLEESEKFKGSASAIQEIAKFSGKATASEQMDLRRKNSFSMLGPATGKTTYGEAFVQTKEGKALTERLSKQNAAGKGGQAVSDLTDQLSTAVMSGAMDIGQAKSLAMNAARQAGDMSLGIKVIAQIEELLGPNGENLVNSPLEVRVKMVEQNKKNLQTSFSNIENANPLQKLAGQKTMQKVGIGASAAGGAAVGATIGAALGSVVPVLGNAVGAIIGGGIGAAAGAIGGYFASKKFANQSAELGAAYAVDAKIAMEQNKQMLDSFDMYMEKKVEELRLQGKINEANELQEKLIDKRNQLTAAQGAIQADIVSQYNNAGGLQESMMSGMQKATSARYKNNPNELAYLDVVNTQAGNLRKSGLIDSGQEFLIQAKMASGDIPPSVFRSLLQMATENKDIAPKMMNIITKFSGATSESIGVAAQNILGADKVINKTVQTDFITKVQAFEKDSDALDFTKNIIKLNNLNSVIPSDFLVGFYIDPKNKAAYDELNRVLDAIETQKPKTIDAVYNIIPELRGSAAFDETYFKSLTDDQKQVYTTTIASIINIPDPQIVADDDYQAWLKETGPRGGAGVKGSVAFKIQKYKEAQGFKAVTNNTQITANAPTSSSSSSGGGNKVQSSELDDLVKRLRDVRKNQIKVTEGWGASQKALNNLFGGSKTIKIFSGIENDMRSLGAGEDLIDLITGMDPKEYEKRKKSLFEFDKKGNITKIKDNARSIGDALQSVKLGEFVSEQEKMSRQIGDQVTALKRLQAAGVDGSVALEAVADATFAAAVANKRLTDTELKKITEAAKKATKAQREMAAIQLATGETTDLENRAKILAKMTKDLSGLSSDTIAAILDSPALQAVMLEFGIDNERFKKLLQLALDKANVELKIKKMTIPGMEEIFQDGFNKATEAFDVEEKKYQLKFDIDTKQANKDIEAAQNEIAKKQFDIDDKEAGLKQIEEQEKKINEKYDERIAALDQVEKANAAISEQQKGQLTLAEALTSGDIAAAARAAQDMRAKEAADAATKQKDALEKSREFELSGVKTKDGKTRKQLEAEIKKLQDEIFDIEEKKLEPAQELIRLREIQLKKEIDGITVLGKTRAEWEGIKNLVDLARIKSAQFVKAMQDALDIYPKLITAYENQKVNTDPINPTGTTTGTPTVTGTGTATGTATGGDDDPKINPGSNGSTGTNPEFRGNAGSTPDGSTGGSKNNGGTTPAKNNNTSDPFYNNSLLHREDLDRMALDAKKNLMLFNQKMNVAEITKNAGNTPGMHVQSLYDQQNAAAIQNAMKPTPGMLAQEKAVRDAAARDAAAAKKAKENASADSARAAAAAKDAKRKQEEILKKFGGNTAAANAFGNWSTGGLIPKYFSFGGFAKGTDTVPAMLTPGEFIMSKYAVDSYGVDTMRKINKGDSIGGSVYNNTYTLTVNAKTNANPNEIAQAVMSTIKQVDDRRIRGVNINGR
jgi:TP901 family phage tail tape measure protein